MMKTYIELWQSGLLISQNRDFPTFESKNDQLTPGPEVFRGQVSSLVRRFKVRSLEGRELLFFVN